MKEDSNINRGNLRQQILSKLISWLRGRGFFVSSFEHTNSCFDILARGDELTIAVKVFSNIDSIREGQAKELKKMGKLFGVNPLIIGERTKAFELKHGVVYERYGVAVLTLRSFEDLLNEKFPYVKYFKGKNIVEIDSEKLRKLRSKKNLSLQDVAEKLNLTKESVHRFEKHATTSLESAKKLEGFFHTKLIKGTALFSKAGVKREFVYDELHDPVLQKIQDIGLGLATFQHAPFRAVGDTREELLIDVGKGRKDIFRKAAELKKSRHALDADSFLVAKDFKERKIDDIAVIAQDELDSLGKKKDLLKAIRERENE